MKSYPISGKPTCVECAHFIFNKKKNICAAFPEETKKFPRGIPWEIISGQDDHSEPFPDQENKIVFKRKDAY